MKISRVLKLCLIAFVATTMLIYYLVEYRTWRGFTVRLKLWLRRPEAGEH